MKRINCIILFNIIFAVFIFADEHFSISSSIGMLEGNQNFYVYDSVRSKSDYHLQSFNTDFSMIPYFQLNTEIRLPRYFSIGFGGRIGYPKESGTFGVHKWMNNYIDKSGNGGYLWPYGDKSKETYTLQSDNNLTQYYQASVTFKSTVHWPFNFVFLPYFSVYYENFIFQQSKGNIKSKVSEVKYFDYGSDEWKLKEDFTTETFDSLFSEERYSSHYALFGFNISWQHFNPLNFDFTYEFCPWLSFASLYYKNKNEENPYTNTLNFYKQMSFDFTISYRITGNHQLKLKNKYILCPEAYNEVKEKEYGDLSIKRNIYDLSVVYVFSY